MVAGEPALERADHGHGADAEHQAGADKAAGKVAAARRSVREPGLDPAAEGLEPGLDGEPLADHPANHQAENHHQEVVGPERAFRPDKEHAQGQPLEHGLAKAVTDPPGAAEPDQAAGDNGQGVDNSAEHGQSPVVA